MPCGSGYRYVMHIDVMCWGWPWMEILVVTSHHPTTHYIHLQPSVIHHPSVTRHHHHCVTIAILFVFQDSIQSPTDEAVISPQQLSSDPAVTKSKVSNTLPWRDWGDWGLLTRRTNTSLLCFNLIATLLLCTWECFAGFPHFGWTSSIHIELLKTEVEEIPNQIARKLAKQFNSDDTWIVFVEPLHKQETASKLWGFWSCFIWLLLSSIKVLPSAFYWRSIERWLLYNHIHSK